MNRHESEYDKHFRNIELIRRKLGAPTSHNQEGDIVYGLIAESLSKDFDANYAHYLGLKESIEEIMTESADRLRRQRVLPNAIELSAATWSNVASNLQRKFVGLLGENITEHEKENAPALGLDFLRGFQHIMGDLIAGESTRMYIKIYCAHWR